MTVLIAVLYMLGSLCFFAGTFLGLAVYLEWL